MADTIYIVASTMLERASLESMLSAFVVQAFDNVGDFLSVVRADASGCVVTPADLPAPGVRYLIDELRARRSALAVVVLGRDHDLRTAVDCIRAGAAEFVEHPLRPRQLRAAVRRALTASHHT